MTNVLLPVSPFSPAFIGLFIVQLAIALYIGKKICEMDHDKKRKVVFYVYLGVFILFCVYKLCMPLDKGYMELYPKLYGKFSYFNELPFNACNVSIWMTCVACLSDKRSLYSFCFFVSCLGPLFAVLLPIEGFNGESLLTEHVFGYYTTHFAALMVPVIFVSSGLYIPKYKDIPKTVFTTIAVAFCAFLISTALRLSGLNPKANYFFCYYHEENPILKLFYGWFGGVPFIYTMPAVLILIVGCFAITAIVQLILKGSDKKVITNEE